MTNNFEPLLLEPGRVAGFGKNMMPQKSLGFVALAASIWFIDVKVCLSQTDLDRDMRRVVELHESLGQQFKAGETNLPILQINSFPGYFESCWVDKSNRVSFRSYFPPIHNSAHWGKDPLSKTNLLLMTDYVNRLPASTNTAIPLRKQFHISGVRSNQWFHVVYDIDKLPDEVDKLHQIINVPFKGRPVTISR